ncbi:MAG: hypothetical protein Q8K78_11560 [Planctomycetaceae bacterium]|nr:hypothetical protein [Planctomycetaceae bacterium]
MNPRDVHADDPEQLATLKPWWQQRWGRFSGWVKIAVSAIGLLAIMHFAVGVRIWYGLKLPPEVAAIQASGRSISLPAELVSWQQPDTWPEAIYYGLRGITARDVRAVRLGLQATDELLVHIGRNFPNVESVGVSGENITSRGIMALKNCPKITYLEVNHCGIGDEVGELLHHLPDLRALHVSHTNIGDAFTVAAAKHQRLAYCDVTMTAVTPDAVKVWKAAQPNCSIRTDFRE